MLQRNVVEEGCSRRPARWVGQAGGEPRIGHLAGGRPSLGLGIELTLKAPGAAAPRGLHGGRYGIPSAGAFPLVRDLRWAAEGRLRATVRATHAGRYRARPRHTESVPGLSARALTTTIRYAR